MTHCRLFLDAGARCEELVLGSGCDIPAPAESERADALTRLQRSGRQDVHVSGSSYSRAFA